MNTIIGDYEGNYEYTTEVNKVIRDAIGTSTIMVYVKELIQIWANKEIQFKIVDD